MTAAKHHAAAHKTHVYIDGIEEGVCRLLIQATAAKDSDWRIYNVPAHVLPPGAKEGSWLELSVHVTPPPPGSHNGPVQQTLAREDDGNDIKL